jgi:3-hydroxybutyryl-CoA dehydrogenase
MDDIKNVAIVGAGTMGWQIALQAATYGYNVSITDLLESAIERAKTTINCSLAEKVDLKEISLKDRVEIFDRIHFTLDLAEAASKADLVIEAIVEKLEPKREVFSKLDQICPPHTILATNSSSIRVSKIESATRRPDKVLNIHFYSLISKKNIVDLMGGTRTSAETLEKARRWIRSIECIPLIAKKEITGFVFNRIWRAIKKEALYMWANGYADFQDIDRAWIVFTGSSDGIFGIMDQIGLDVVYDIENVYFSESGDPRDRPPQALKEMINRGELGVKTGKGFYSYPNPAFKQPGWLKGEE